MTNKPRLTITMSDELFASVEDYRFDNRFETKSDAISSLIELGLKELEKEKRKKKK